MTNHPYLRVEHHNAAHQEYAPVAAERPLCPASKNIMKDQRRRPEGG
jgi:hypothetical protein